MAQNLHNWQFGVIGGMVLGSAIALIPTPGLAQLNLTPDTQPGRSLGTTIQPRSPQVDVVTGGTASQNGVNLFHSFAEFNVGSGRSVLFANPAGVRNILSRVTGSDPSDILGTLGVEGAANLFLLNPNGIIFGSGASLNVSGAFVATTADEIQFGNLGSFSAFPAAGENPALLTIDPSALLFNQISSPVGSISVSRTSNSQVTLSNPSQSLLLVGEAINLNRANLSATGGRIELGAVSSPARVDFERDAFGGDLRLNIPTIAARANVSITRSNISVTASNGGNIALYGKDIKISNSQVTAGIADGQGSINSRGGDILLNATGLLALDGNSEISSEVGRTSIGSGGNILVEADAVSIVGRRTQIRTVTDSQQPACLNHPCNAGNIILRARTLDITNPPQLTGDGAGLQANTTGIGNAGNITVEVSESASLSNRGRIESEVRPPERNQPLVIGNAGNIRISAHSLSLFNVGRIAAGSQGEGSAGNISITADSVSLIRSSRITSNIDNGDQVLSGNDREGNITIAARTVSLIDGGFIQANTNAASNGGNIRIDASDSVSLSGLDRDRQFRSSISAAAMSDATGRGGNTTINTGILRVSDGAVVSARTESSSIGGNVTVNANRVELLSGGQIVTTAYSSGNAGSITVNATDEILLSGNDPDFDADILEALRRLRLGIIPSIDLVIVTDGSPSGLFARTIRTSGSAGSLNINTPLLQVENGAQVAASTLPPTSGQGGNITIRGDRLILRGGELTVNSEGTGKAGNLNTMVPIIRLDDRARIGAGTVGSSGGNIVLQDVTSLQVNNSQIAASTIDGEGGSLDIQAAGGTVLLNGADGLSVEATGRGSAGNLTIAARDVTVQNGARIAASNVSSTSTLDVGNIRLTDLDTLVVSGNGQVSASTQTGRAGSLSINARRSIGLDQGALTVEATGGGSAGSLRIDTNQLTAQNDSRVTVSSTGVGTAGELAIAARSVFLNNRTQFTAETAAGRGGNIQLRIADRVRLQNNSAISASTQSGRGGSLTLDGNGGDRVNLVQLNSGSQLSASANSGIAGQLTVTARQLILDDRAGRPDPARIVASTVSGSGGGIRLTGLDTLRVNNGRIAASTDSGTGGSLTVDAPGSRVELSGTGELSVEASGTGSAGNLILNAAQLILTDRAQLSAANRVSNRVGDFGNIRLQGLENLTVLDNSRISASTQTGRAGSLSIAARNTVAVSGGGLFVEATGNGGTAGNLFISTRRLSVQDGGRVSVRSRQGQAGNLTVQADTIALNRGTLTAATAASGAGQGANIRLLGLRQLTMRDRSLISARATAGANGGNIEIDAAGGFIVAVPNENSDIIASAANRGTGGEINITTQGIFGLVPITGDSVPISEINASSDFGINGEVIINTPDVDPSRGLIELPTDVSDASQLIAQGCSGRGGAIANRQQSEFVLTGRGGLPLSPEEPLNSTAVVTSWVALESPPSTPASTISSIPVESAAPVVEAQGWTLDRSGQVILTADASEVTPSRPGLLPAACHASNIE